MKKALSLVMALALAMGIAGCGQSASSDAASSDAAASDATSEASSTDAAVSDDEVIVLRFGDAAVPGTGEYEGNLRFIELVEEKTGGRVTVEHYASGQMGSDINVTQALMANTLELGKCSTGNLSGFTSVLDFCDLPGMFRNEDHVYAVFNSEIRDELSQAIYDEIGLYPIAYDVDGGAARSFFNTQREVRTPADAAGLKIRTTGTPIEIALYEAWGVGATPLSWQELFTGLQQKVVDGVYAGPVPSHTSKFTEITKYATMLDLSFGPSVRLMSQSAIDELGGFDGELFKLVCEAAREAEGIKRDLVDAEFAGVVEQMEAAGVSVYYPTEEEVALWTESAQSIWPEFVGDGEDKIISQELVDRIQALDDSLGQIGSAAATESTEAAESTAATESAAESSSEAAESAAA